MLRRYSPGSADGGERRAGGIAAAVEARACAHEVERGTTRAREVARGRPELACMDARNARRELGLERRDFRKRERRRRDGIGPLEEVIDDLDLLRTGAEARERIDEPLQPVVLLDDLLGARLADDVRLVVEHERPCPLQVERVEVSVQQDTVLEEREMPLLVDARKLGDPLCEL